MSDLYRPAGPAIYRIRCEMEVLWFAADGAPPSEGDMRRALEDELRAHAEYDAEVHLPGAPAPEGWDDETICYADPSVADTTLAEARQLAWGEGRC